jgi:hypothetical protein
MSSAARAANVRTILATAAVTNLAQITHLDLNSCTVVVADPTRLSGTFAALGVQDFQMSALRALLAKSCPEKDVHDAVQDPQQFPLSADIAIDIVIGALEALLDNSSNFQGACVTPGGIA